MTHIYLAPLAALFLVAAVGTAAAQAPAPPEGFKLVPAVTETSPDRAMTSEQYARMDKERGYLWHFWVRRGDKAALLEAEPADYPAGFRFTTDSRWLVRTQKTGAGYADLYLYRLGPDGFVAATEKPLSELAWNYFNGRPEARKIIKPDYHISAGLVKGVDDNYRWMGVKWPGNRYLVISLWGEADSNEQHRQLSTVRGWRCRYDLATSRFDVPASFARYNAKAIAPERK